MERRLCRWRSAAVGGERRERNKGPRRGERSGQFNSQRYIFGRRSNDVAGAEGDPADGTVRTMIRARVRAVVLLDYELRAEQKQADPKDGDQSL